MAVKMKSLNCSYCGEPFEKRLSEYNRCLKRGHNNHYCSQSCQVSHGNQLKPRGSTTQLNPANRRDGYTEYRYFLKMAKSRVKAGDNKALTHTDLDLDYLVGLWQEQEGKCPLTGWNLILPNDSDGSWKSKLPNNASLDRIDSNQSYIKGNVRYVALIANLTKNIFTDTELIDFCKAVFHKQPYT